MKLTIWQQFGSNHSNDFTIVGRFASAEDAIAAQKKFEKILELMIVNSKKDEANKLLKEQMLKLGLGWEHERIPDWLNVAGVEIQNYDGMLFVEVYNNWSFHQPLDSLLHQLGSENTGIDGEMVGSRPIWTFDFDILNTEKANAFETLIVDILTMDRAIIKSRDFTFPDTSMGIVDWRGDEAYGAHTIKFSRNDNHFQLDNVDFWLGWVSYDYFSHFADWLKRAGAENIKASARN